MLYFERYATVGDVLTYKEDEDTVHTTPITVSENSTLSEVLTCMADYNVGVVFIKNKLDHIFGLISERDIIKHCAKNGRNVFDMSISPLISHEILSCNKGEYLKQVAAQMAHEKIRHLAVKNDEGAYICVVSSSDIELFAGEG